MSKLVSKHFSKLVSNVVATQYETCPPSHLKFNDVISRRTAYGLIWSGSYRHHDCVIKMIMLSTGIHYDKNAKEYHTPNGQPMTEAIADKYFNHNDEKPFFHIDFRHRRTMTPEEFFKELDECVYLANIGIAPKIYGYGIHRTYEIHYGFIVMEKVDCSLKDLYLKRELDPHECKIIKDLIEQMHEKHEIIHGDLKPSNVGVYLDKNGLVVDACLFDCQKIRHKDSMTPNDFNKYAIRETTNFQKHIIMNIEEGQLIAKKMKNITQL